VLIQFQKFSLLLDILNSSRSIYFFTKNTCVVLKHITRRKDYLNQYTLFIIEDHFRVLNINITNVYTGKYIPTYMLE